MPAQYLFLESITSKSFMKNHVIEPQAMTKAKLMRKVLNEPDNAIFSNDYEHFQNGPEFACKVLVLI